MSKEYVIVPKEDYVDTCDAIREKINSTALLKSDEMAQAVRDIPSPKEEQEKTVDITENGTYDVLPDEGKVLSRVTVNTNVADSYYDTFWDVFQQNGTRTDYNTAFANGYFNTENFKPKYDIKPTSCQNIFNSFLDKVDLREVLNTCGITLDFSNVTSGNYVFSRSKFTALPALNCPNGYSYWFFNCSLLHTIDKIVFNKEMSSTQLNAFSNCFALKNIVIEGEIGSNIIFKSSTLLTVESAKSIITHLVNYTGTENEFVYSVLFADSVWELLNAEGATAPGNITWEEYVNSIGWNK